MAMTKCKECGAEISSRAEACPRCGARIRRTRLAVKLLAIFFGVGLIGAIVEGVRNPSGGTAINPKTPEQKAKEEADTKRFVVAAAVAETLKKAVRDPDSLKFDSVRISDDAKVACVEYRARNGFGGMNREIVIFVDGVSRSDAATWNKRCTGKMYDYLYAAQ